MEIFLEQCFGFGYNNGSDNEILLQTNNEINEQHKFNPLVT